MSGDKDVAWANKSAERNRLLARRERLQLDAGLGTDDAVAKLFDEDALRLERIAHRLSGMPLDVPPAPPIQAQPPTKRVPWGVIVVVLVIGLWLGLILTPLILRCRRG